jgi:prephenate dehydratase
MALSSRVVTETNTNPTLAYLGPVGTFTEQAMLTQPDLASMELIRYSTIVEVLRAVENGSVDYGFAAIENMIEGAVNATIDTLAFDADLLIQREVVMNVNLNLLVQPGVTIDDIEHVRSMPVAYAQCRRYLADNLAKAAIEATNSTADAARELAESGRTDTAAIAPRRSAEVYGLEILAANIEDHPENQTRFVLVGREGVTPPSGHDKTSIVIYQRADEPGSLVAILSEFAARNINLTKLESRPTRKGLGDYCFLIDCEGHLADQVVGDTLRNIQMKHGVVKFLGSYPSAYGTAEEQANNRGAGSEADAWLAELRSQISE